MTNIKDAPQWRCEIKHGPEGEANYAWVYNADGEMVCTAKTYHAQAIVTRMNALSQLTASPDREKVAAEALRLLAAEDERQSKLHDLLETIREQVRLGVPPESRPDGLFKNVQDAVYAMRGRTPLMKDAAITSPLATIAPDEAASTDPLDDLVCRFSAALLEKLKAAREKYGYGDEGWRDNDWEDECQIKLLSHLAKGDPRDVAAYCAFMWHHGWSTVAPEPLRIIRTQKHIKTLPTDEAAIRADERERCAKIAESPDRQDEWPKSVDVERTSPSRIMQQTIAAAIRSQEAGR